MDGCSGCSNLVRGAWAVMAAGAWFLWHGAPSFGGVQQGLLGKVADEAVSHQTLAIVGWQPGLEAVNDRGLFTVD